MMGRVYILGLLACGMAVGQRPAGKPMAAAAKQVEFEVVSIRPSNGRERVAPSGITPDGYRAMNVSLAITVANAYIPQKLQLTDKIVGLPSWSTKVMYDVVAKVAPSDVAAWQQQGPKQELLHAALQKMLAERCKLVVHTIPADVDGWSLVVGKHGAKLKATPANEVLPAGMPLHGGGVLAGYARGSTPQVSFYGVSMDGFSEWLMQSSVGHPVLDKTGLNGRYDMVLLPKDMGESSDKGIAVSLNGTNPADTWNIEAFGLRLIPAKVPAETIMIDHIEPPSSN